MRTIDLTLATDKFIAAAPDPDALLDDDTSNVVDLDGEPAERPPEREVTHPVRLNANLIAYYHPRQPNSRSGRERVGTRIVLENGNALAVAELYDDVRDKIAEALQA